MQNSDNDNRDLIARTLPWVLLAIATVAIVLGAVAVDIYTEQFAVNTLKTKDIDSWGQLGDFFGGVLNPTFSFLALVALLLTLYVQSRELKLSRQMAELSWQELQMTREELKNSAEALKAQNDAINHQRFEQTFFAWLESYRSLVGGLKRTEQRRQKNGDLAVFEMSGLELMRSLCEDVLQNQWVLDSLRHRAVISKDETFSSIPSERHGSVIKALAIERREFFHKRDGSELGAPITTLEALLKWITAQSSFDDQTKRQYIAIIRAQLGPTEQSLLLYAIAGPEWAHLRTLVEYHEVIDIQRLCQDDFHAFLWHHRNHIANSIYDLVLSPISD